MTQQELIKIIATKGGELKGSTRPANNRQLDRWLVDKSSYLVTSDRLWNPQIQSPGNVIHEYDIRDILSIEMLVSLPK